MHSTRKGRTIGQAVIEVVGGVVEVVELEAGREVDRGRARRSGLATACGVDGTGGEAGGVDGHAGPLDRAGEQQSVTARRGVSERW